MLHAAPWLLAALVTSFQDTLRTTQADTLETVVVTTTRTAAAGPGTRSGLDRVAIRRTVPGQDLPLSLRGLPSVTATSDAGGFTGYSALRIRGIDQTRLTISLDGVPLNDPEDQVLYFSNLPGLMGSLESIQVGRGVSGSGFGTASFGGSLNLMSLPLGATARSASGEIGAGSFGTSRMSLGGATGWSGAAAALGRISWQRTDGYRRNAGNNGWSAFGSAAWFGSSGMLKVTGLVGRSRTGLAYYAAAEPELVLDRRANPLGPDERDDFTQSLASVQYSRGVGRSGLVTVTGYRNGAAGDYDVRVGDQLWNFNLAHAWYGLLATGRWTFRFADLAVGLHASDYHRDHFLLVRPDLGTRVYHNRGYKQEQNGFIKVGLGRGPVSLNLDLEARRAAWAYRPSSGSGLDRLSIDWAFVNPRAGLEWRPNRHANIVASYGRTSREPARTDLLAGADDIDSTAAAEVLPLSRVKPERVDDWELGARWRGRTLWFGVNGFVMRFRNEIAPTGAIAITGNPLRRNVPRSYRAGAELEGEWRPSGALTVSANTTLMTARIAEYADQVAGVTRRDVAPLLTPSMIGNLAAQWQVDSRLGLHGAVRYVGTSQLANDGNAVLRLPAATLLDVGAALRLGRIGFRAEVQNLTNANAFASGYTDGATRFFFPVAERSVFLTAVIGSR